MVFGIFIDVPLIVGGFFIMFHFRKRLARDILGVKLPPLAIYLILSVPLIIFEEHIDCMPSWCGAVAIPPTLPFLFIEMLVLGGIVLMVHARNALRVTLVFSIYGVLFELLLGGLVGAPLIVVILLAPYVAVGYAFISMLPLTILMEKEGAPEGGKGALSAPVGSTRFHTWGSIWNRRSSLSRNQTGRRTVLWEIGGAKGTIRLTG